MKSDVYFKNIEGWGNLYIDHIFIMFEGEPILFTCINECNDLYLVLCNEIRNEYKWLIVPISTYGLRRLIEKKDDLFTAFAKNGSLVIVTVDCDGHERHGEEYIDTIDTNELPERGINLRCDERSAMEYIDEMLKVARFKTMLQKELIVCRYITDEQTEFRDFLYEKGYSKNNFNNRVIEDSLYETNTSTKYRSDCSDKICAGLGYIYFDAA